MIEHDGALKGMEITDDINKYLDSNEMIENVIQSLMNISNDLTLHEELIKNGLLEVIKKYVHLFRACLKSENSAGEDETVVGIDLEVIPVEPSQLLKCLILMMMNLSSNPCVQEECLQLGMPTLII